jgi:hypothetical protein
VVRHIFQACPVWIYTQSNITSIKAELLTTDIWDDKMAPNLDKVEVLPCRWLNSYDLLESKLKLI